MRQITTAEMLALNKFLQMETNALAMSKAGINAIGDDQLRSLTQAGINTTEARIKGLQQFIAENHITASTNNSSTFVNMNSTSSDNRESKDIDNLPGGVF